MKYIQNYIKMATINMLRQKARYYARRPILASADTEINDREETVLDYVGDSSHNSTANSINCFELIQIVPNKRYPYTIRIDNKVLPLTVHNVLTLLSQGIIRKDIVENTYNILNHNIPRQQASRYYKEIIEYSRNYIKTYTDLI